jgi:hypothetical protein
VEFNFFQTLPMQAQHSSKRQVMAAWLSSALMLLSCAAASLDQRVVIALGKGEETSFEERLAAVHSLYEKLSGSDAEILYKEIVAPSQPQGLELGEWAALSNDVLNAIGKLSEPLENYPLRLLGLIGEEARPTVLRDYALQHLLSHLEFKLEAAAREEILKKIEPLVSAAPASTLPGTYLLGIWQLAGKPGYPPTEAIGKAALALAVNPDAFIPNRITAIQVCGQLGYKPALPAAREMASDAALRTGLRAAAISSIGLLSEGGEEDQRILTELKRWGDTRLQHAADSALKRLNDPSSHS